MPSIRLSVSERCALLTTYISLNREIMSLCFYYTKKRLIYIIIINPFGRQPFSYAKYTKLNTYILFNMHSVSLNKYISFYYIYCYTY